MIPYAQVKCFDKRMLHCYRLAYRITQWLPGWYDGERTRCHEVARIVNILLLDKALGNTEVVDGKYGGIDHSWINLLPAEGLPPTSQRILDTYAVGQLPQVQLVDCFGRLGAAYEPGEMRTDIKTHFVHTCVLAWRKEQQ